MRVPEREDLDPSQVFDHVVVEVVTDTREMQPTNARQREIPGAGADSRLEGDERGGAFELLANGVRRPGAVDAPPPLGRNDLRPGEVADLDVERRTTHSRLRNSESTLAIGVVRPSLH